MKRNTDCVGTGCASAEVLDFRSIASMVYEETSGGSNRRNILFDFVDGDSRLIYGGMAPGDELAVQVEGDVGIDLRVTKYESVRPMSVDGNLRLISHHLGIRLAMPEGVWAMLAMRSSTPKRTGLIMPAGVGIIDTGYRGEIIMQGVHLGLYEMKIGQRIAQLVFFNRGPYEVDLTRMIYQPGCCTDTARGSGGFGSTGVA